VRQPKACHRCKLLESIILDISWMSRRYADGRNTYAPAMYNDAIKEALQLGLPIQKDTTVEPPTLFAREG
jgi:hypothetical protein